MSDAYSVLGISPGADEETVKKAYRQKCKQYHPDLHPGDPTAEEKFKEVQAAYSEITHPQPRRQQASSTPYQSYGGQSSGYGSYGQGYQNPFGAGGFGFGPFGFGFYSSSGGDSRQTYTTGRESPEMQAAGNYIRNRCYEEALRTLNGIANAERDAQWHYYCALANLGLGNNIRAQEEARTAVSMEPNNYAYQNLLDRLQTPGRTYSQQQSPYAQPGGGAGRFCLSMMLYSFLCNCCCGRGFYFC